SNSHYLEMEFKRPNAQKRNSFNGIRNRVGGQPIYRIRLTRQDGLIMASRHRKMSTLGTGVGEREEKVIELILNLQTIVLNRRLLETRIDICRDYRGSIPRVWRTGQHGADEVREGRGRRQYGKRMLQAGSCIGGADQILEELERRIEAQGGGGPQEVG